MASTPVTLKRLLLLLALLFFKANTLLATEISVLSYNVFLRAPPWIFQDDHDTRSTDIPDFLKGYDAVVLQEAFSNPHRSSILSALATEYPFHSGVLEQDSYFSFNGGVVILSRWPITHRDQLVFNGCEGSDCIVQKGVIYTALDIDGRAVHLFGLHLQAQKEYASARVAQFPQLADFIKRKEIPQSELVLVAGDFNVDYFSDDQDGEFTLLTNSVGLDFPENAPRASYDSNSNNMVDSKVSERLDYVFYSARHLKPRSASNEILVFRKNNRDLSDHHAVAGHFTLGNEP